MDEARTERVHQFKILLWLVKIRLHSSNKLSFNPIRKLHLPVAWYWESHVRWSNTNYYNAQNVWRWQSKYIFIAHFMLLKHRVQRFQLREYCSFTLIPLTQQSSPIYISTKLPKSGVQPIEVGWNGSSPLRNSDVESTLKVPFSPRRLIAILELDP